MSDEIQDDLENLQRRVAALESLVVDLLGAVGDIDKSALAKRLADPAVQIGSALAKPLGLSARRRRDALLKAAER